MCVFSQAGECKELEKGCWEKEEEEDEEGLKPPQVILPLKGIIEFSWFSFILC